MGVRRILTAAVFDTGPSTVYECRACGTTLDAGEAVCPYCGPTDVAEFDLRG